MSKKEQRLWSVGGLAGPTMILLIFGFFFIQQQYTLSHDSMISFLAATGHQEEYAIATGAEGELANRWSTAAEWKQLWTVGNNDEWEFPTIRKDLANYDIHPPLYFWLLHIAFVLFGATIATAVGLNLTISISIAASLWGLLRWSEASSRMAATACVVWALSPGVWAGILESRQYMLMTLFSLWTVWIVGSILREEREGLKPWGMLWAVISLGLLTHYHFILVAAISLGVLLVFSRERLEVLLRSVVVGVGSVATLFAAHPTFYRSFIRQGEQAQDFELGGVVQRIFSWGTGVTHFLMPPEWGRGSILITALVGGVIITGVLYVSWKYKKALLDAPRWLCGVVMVPLLLFIVQFFLYIFYFSPAHAAGERYFVIYWVVLAILATLALSLSRFRDSATMLFLLSLVLVLSFWGSQQKAQKEIFEERAQTLFTKEHSFVLTDARRGIAPVGLRFLKDESPVFFAESREGLENLEMGQVLFWQVTGDGVIETKELREVWMKNKVTGKYVSGMAGWRQLWVTLPK